MIESQQGWDPGYSYYYSFLFFIFAYIVRQMLIKRSQPQPVMKNAAAGGKMIATCGCKGCAGAEEKKKKKNAPPGAVW